MKITTLFRLYDERLFSLAFLTPVQPCAPTFHTDVICPREKINSLSAIYLLETVALRRAWGRKRFFKVELGSLNAKLPNSASTHRNNLL